MKQYFFLSVFIILSVFCHAQKDKTNALYGYDITKPDKNYGIGETVHSKSMNIDLPVLVFVPKIYKDSKDSFPVVYLLHGSGGQALGVPLLEEGLRKANNRGVRIQETADFYNVIIVAPIVGNTYYLDAPLRPEIRFATYIGEELPAFIDSKYKTFANRDNRFLAGFSMGGYGAVSLLCRYPDNFSVALERFGVMNLATGIEDLDWDDPTPNLMLMLGNYWENKKNWHQNSCFNLVNHIRDRDDIAIVIELGQDEFLKKTNMQFRDRLEELGVPYIYSEYPGGHQWSAEALNSLLAQLQYFKKTVR